MQQVRLHGCRTIRRFGAAGIGGGAVVLFYSAWPGCWSAAIRARGTVIPLFAPPAGMSAAATRFVEDMTFDDRVFTAAIVGLGVNGHLKLVDQGATQELRHVKGNGKLDDAEQAVECLLFAKQSTVALDKSDAVALSGARAALHSDVEAGLYRHDVPQQFRVVEHRSRRRRAGDFGHRDRLFATATARALAAILRRHVHPFDPDHDRRSA